MADAHIIEEGSGRKFVDRLINDGGNIKERERVFTCHNGTLTERETMHINAGDQTTKIQNYKCNKDLPNLVCTIMNTQTVISQYLFSVMILDAV